MAAPACHALSHQYLLSAPPQPLNNTQLDIEQLQSDDRPCMPCTMHAVTVSRLWAKVNTIFGERRKPLVVDNFHAIYLKCVSVCQWLILSVRFLCFSCKVVENHPKTGSFGSHISGEGPQILDNHFRIWLTSKHVAKCH